MIISNFFEGDDDEPTKRVQHDHYGQALWIIVGGCREHVRAAEAILLTREIWVQAFIASDSFDHRRVQMAHDILAAAWRFKSDRTHPALAFDGAEEWRRETAAVWLDWLRSEIDSWPRWSPGLIRATIQAIANQDTPKLYAVEDSLVLQLFRAYPTVPWRPSLLSSVGLP